MSSNRYLFLCILYFQQTSGANKCHNLSDDILLNICHGCLTGSLVCVPLEVEFCPNKAETKCGLLQTVLR